MMGPIAIDAQIVLRNHARRIVCGMAEACGVDVILPETVVTMAKHHYATVCESYVTRTLEWRNDIDGGPVDDEKMGLLIHDAVQRVAVGFGEWMDSEPQRNDALFTTAARTRRAQGLAMELARAGVVEDPEDRRWTVGEDPYVIAEALDAGAQWLASDNFETLKPEAMERWLDKVQKTGRFMDAPRPFIISAEQALTTMQTESPRLGRMDGVKVRRAVAHAVSRPTDIDAKTIDERIQIFGRFAADLRKCGMRTTGKEMERWTRQMRALRKREGSESIRAALGELETIVSTDMVARVRNAEERRMKHEGLVNRAQAGGAGKPSRESGLEG